jgi:hypothetical protein
VFDRRVVHIVVLCYILNNHFGSICGSTKEWLMALNLVIVDNYCLSIGLSCFRQLILKFDGGVVHVVVCDIVVDNVMIFYQAVVRVAVFHIIDNYCLRFDSGVVHVVIAHIDDSYCLRFALCCVNYKKVHSTHSRK